MFDLTTYLTERRRQVEAELDRLLPPATDEPPALHAAMRYAVFTGGKRLRPILSMAAAEACGGRAETGLQPGCAVEILHTYTLVHDDLPCMDDDATRRGKPTVHIAFGETNAVLAGDALQAFAFELLGRVPSASPWTTGNLVGELANAAGSHGVVGGQVADLSVPQDAPTPEQIDFIHLHKTADLFRAAVRLGAMAAGGTAAQVEALTCYAVNLGLAFQITDDLLDAPAPGQPPGETSCLSIYTPAAARARVSDRVGEAVAALSRCAETGIEALKAVAEYVPDRGH